jgi:spore coat polysaccharide biosynthesis protein SpsF
MTGASAVFLQARLDSSRLPAKALAELAGEPAVCLCMKALSELPADRHCLLTDSASADVLAPFARRCGWQLFSGPRDDVLARFVLAADHYGVEHVWRATADNPLVSVELCRLIQAAYLAQGAEHAVMVEVPHGSCVEAVSVQALRTVRAESRDPFEREHVCPGIWRHPERWRVLRLEPPVWLRRPDISVTLDTFDDYRRLRELFAAEYQGVPIPLERAIAHFDASRVEACA